MGDIELHQPLSFYFRSTLLQRYSIEDSYKEIKRLYAISDGCIQILTVVYKSRNLWINLES